MKLKVTTTIIYDIPASEAPMFKTALERHAWNDLDRIIELSQQCQSLALRPRKILEQHKYEGVE